MNWCSAVASFGEQLPEDGVVRPKRVAIKCNFIDILKQKRDSEQFVLHWRRKLVNE
jgi:hypothetical protein